MVRGPQERTRRLSCAAGQSCREVRTGMHQCLQLTVDACRSDRDCRGGQQCVLHWYRHRGGASRAAACESWRTNSCPEGFVWGAGECESPVRKGSPARKSESSASECMGEAELGGWREAGRGGWRAVHSGGRDARAHEAPAAACPPPRPLARSGRFAPTRGWPLPVYPAGRVRRGPSVPRRAFLQAHRAAAVDAPFRHEDASPREPRGPVCTRPHCAPVSPPRPPPCPPCACVDVAVSWRSRVSRDARPAPSPRAGCSRRSSRCSPVRCRTRADEHAPPGAARGEPRAGARHGAADVRALRGGGPRARLRAPEPARASAARGPRQRRGAAGAARRAQPGPRPRLIQGADDVGRCREGEPEGDRGEARGGRRGAGAVGALHTVGPRGREVHGAPAAARPFRRLQAVTDVPLHCRGRKASSRPGPSSPRNGRFVRKRRGYLPRGSSRGAEGVASPVP
jgi:hypothetical protein